MEDQVKKTVRAYLKKAHQEMESAKILFEKEFYDQTVSSCYYCVFHATKAALESIQVTTVSHKQTAIQFHNHFVKTEKVSKHFGEILKELSQNRSFADYDITWAAQKNEAEEALQKASAFLSVIEEILKIGSSKESLGV